MKKVFFATLIVMTMSSAAFASVILSYVESPTTVPGLTSYTIQATGVGITTLSTFTIDGNVNQEFSLSSPHGTICQSEWIGNGSADPNGSGLDSYVIFGDQRIMGDDPYSATIETILDGSIAGPGTLNNYLDGGVQYTWDCYLQNNAGAPPGAPTETEDLLHLVIADADSVDISLKLFTTTDYDSVTGDSTITEYDLSLSIVPEPGVIVMLLAAGLWFFTCFFRNKP